MPTMDTVNSAVMPSFKAAREECESYGISADERTVKWHVHDGKCTSACEKVIITRLFTSEQVKKFNDSTRKGVFLLDAAMDNTLKEAYDAWCLLKGKTSFVATFYGGAQVGKLDVNAKGMGWLDDEGVRLIFDLLRREVGLMRVFFPPPSLNAFILVRSDAIHAEYIMMERRDFVIEETLKIWNAHKSGYYSRLCLIDHDHDLERVS